MTTTASPSKLQQLLARYRGGVSMTRARKLELRLAPYTVESFVPPRAK